MAPEGIIGANPPSVNLWIGNLSSEVSEAELKSLLENYGEVDSITAHASKNYAFVYFNRVEDAISAKNGLQGFALRGKHLKIEFARPTKPCKSLWVAGISPSHPRDEVEKIFLSCGQIQEFRFLKDGTTAFVDYVHLEDAIEALKVLNGKRFGSSLFRIDFLRSQPAKRQPLLPVVPQQGYLSVSNVLLIRHPPSIIIEEEMLHYAMILFGEIENIKIFSDRSCAFVEFRSVEEARRAKEGLQGKLFNDPRISIEFVASEFPLARGPFGEYSAQPGQMDLLGFNRGVPHGNNPGLIPLGIHEPDLYMPPPLISHGTFIPPHHGQEFLDLEAVHKMQNSAPQMLINEPNWRASPTHGLATSTKPAFNVSKRPATGTWDAHDANLLSRDSKRVRLEAASPRTVENHAGVDREHGPYSLSNVDTGLRKRHSDGDCIWRGLIAKGGTPVCHARCVAIGDGLDSDIPKVVNCSARTGLDLLTKHYEDAIGYDVVFFLPDSEDDFGSYTEFLRYLGSNDRAGVAKFDDGTTLFLVPPSKFLSKVLKVSGPERLYGVILKFAPTVPDNVAPNPHPAQANQRNMTKLQTGYGNLPLEERPLPFISNKVLVEDSPALQKAPLTSSSLYPAQSVETAAAGSQIGVSLTPELIATLTSLLPVRSDPTVHVPTSNGASEPNIGHKVQDQNGQAVQHFGGQFSSQFQHLRAIQSSPVVSDHLSMPINSYNQIDALSHGSSSSFPQAPVNALQVASQDIKQSHNGMRDQVSDAQRLYSSSFVQQPAYPLGNQVQQQYNTQVHPEISNQGQLNQSSSNVSAETEADKNERYKTTLLFAANLLSKIHQPSSNQPGQGA